MYRRTYWRLLAKAIKAQDRALGLEIDEARRRFPGLFTEERGLPPTQGAARRSGAGGSSRRVPRVRLQLGTIAVGARGPLVRVSPPGVMGPGDVREGTVGESEGQAA